MKKLLAISLGWEQETALCMVAKKENWQIYGIHYDAEYTRKIEFEKVYSGDLRNIAEIIDFADTIIPDAILTDEDDYGMFLHALLAARYGIPGPSILAAQVACNKFIQRQKADALGILVPAFRLALSPGDIEEFAGSHGFPLIIKPLESRGSIGVSVINNALEILPAFLSAIGISGNMQVLVEKFIEGSHFNVDGYCFRETGPQALAASRNRKLASSRDTINDSIIYGDLSHDSLQELLVTGTHVARELGFRFGFFHGEFIQCSRTQRIYLTEMANRGGGILISQLILPYVTGLPLMDELINDCLGEKAPNKATTSVEQNYARIDFIQLPAGRIFPGIDPEKISASDNGILRIVPFLKTGAVVPAVSNGARRHIMLVSTVRNETALKKIISKILSEVAHAVTR